MMGRTTTTTTTASFESGAPTPTAAPTQRPPADGIRSTSPSAHAQSASLTRAPTNAAPGHPQTHRQRSQGWAAFRWRPIDITVASVTAVACGLVFWTVDLTMTVPASMLEGVVPGLSGILSGFWFIAGVLAMIIIRKPGAAIYAETVGAALELALGNQWGLTGSLIVGVVQGLLTESVFLVFKYRRWNVWITTFAGMLTSLGEIGYSMLFRYAGIPLSGGFITIFIITNLVSGAVIAGVAMWWMYKAIARTGALNSFASGRAAFFTPPKAASSGLAKPSHQCRAESDR